MKRSQIFVLVVLILMAWGVGNLRAQDKKMGRKSLSRDQLIQLALSAAPPHIAKDATVMIPDDDGKLVEAKKGSNGFTCIPDTGDTPKAHPICMDEAAHQWMTSMKNNELKPANTVPGVAYMAKGGQHWVKDGKVLMKEEPGANLVDEPPHWMVMWPFESKTSKFPSPLNPGGVFIIFDGTPLYPHDGLSESE